MIARFSMFLLWSHGPGCPGIQQSSNDFSSLETPDVENTQKAQPTPVYPRAVVLYQSDKTTFTPPVRPSHHRHDSLTSTTRADVSVTKASNGESSFSLPGFADRQDSVLSYLASFGIHQHRIVRALRTSTTTRSRVDAPRWQEQPLYEQHIYNWASRYFGFGICLSKRKPYGSLLPSLSTYPVVPDLRNEWSLIATGSISDIQLDFATQKLHPFMQDQDGENLRHVCNIPMERA